MAERERKATCVICQNVNLRDQFEQDGRIWFRNAISEQDLADFDAAVDLEAKAGQRVEISQALTRALAPGQSLRAAIGQIDPQAKPVRIVGFNKSSQSNRPCHCGCRQGRSRWVSKLDEEICNMVL